MRSRSRFHTWLPAAPNAQLAPVAHGSRGLFIVSWRCFVLAPLAQSAGNDLGPVVKPRGLFYGAYSPTPTNQLQKRSSRAPPSHRAGMGTAVNPWPCTSAWGLFLCLHLCVSDRKMGRKGNPQVTRWGHEQQTGAARERMPILPRDRLRCRGAADNDRALFARPATLSGMRRHGSRAATQRLGVNLLVCASCARRLARWASNS